MELQFKIKETGKDSVVVRAALVDFVAWEEHFERPSSSLMGGDSFYVRDFTWLTWHAQHRQKNTDLDFMMWLETLEDFESTEVVDLVPLESPPVIGSSPVLPLKPE